MSHLRTGATNLLAKYRSSSQRTPCCLQKHTTAVILDRNVGQRCLPGVSVPAVCNTTLATKYGRVRRSLNGGLALSAIGSVAEAPTRAEGHILRESVTAEPEYDVEGNFDTYTIGAKGYDEVQSARRNIGLAEAYVQELDDVLQGLRESNDETVTRAVFGSIAPPPPSTPASSVKRSTGNSSSRRTKTSTNDQSPAAPDVAANSIQTKRAKRSQMNYLPSGLASKTPQLDTAWEGLDLSLDLNDIAKQLSASSYIEESSSDLVPSITSSRLKAATEMIPSTSKPSATGRTTHSRRSAQELSPHLEVAADDSDLVVSSKGKETPSARRSRRNTAQRKPLGASGQQTGRNSRRRRAKLEEEDVHNTATTLSGNSYFKLGEGCTQLLTAQQEVDLALQVQDYVLVDGVRKALAQKLGTKPDVADVAKELKIDIFDCQLRLERGRQARKILLNRNVRLVVSIAKNFMNRGLDMEELVSEGLDGLMRGVEKFDPSKGCKLSTYAHWWIRQSLSRAIAEQRSLVRLPAHVQEMTFKLLKAQKAFHESHGRYPTNQELSEVSGCKVESVEKFRTPAKDAQSLDRQAFEKSRGETIGDGIEDEGTDDADSDAMMEALHGDVEDVLSKLDERESFILRHRYGIGCAPKILEDIGTLLDLTRERVRQIEIVAVRKLRQRLPQGMLKDYEGNNPFEEQQVASRRSLGTKKT